MEGNIWIYMYIWVILYHKVKNRIRVQRYIELDVPKYGLKIKREERAALRSYPEHGTAEGQVKLGKLYRRSAKCRRNSRGGKRRLLFGGEAALVPKRRLPSSKKSHRMLNLLDQRLRPLTPIHQQTRRTALVWLRVNPLKSGRVSRPSLRDGSWQSHVPVVLRKKVENESASTKITTSTMRAVGLREERGTADRNTNHFSTGARHDLTKKSAAY